MRRWLNSRRRQSSLTVKSEREKGLIIHGEVAVLDPDSVPSSCAASTSVAVCAQQRQQ